MGNGFVLKADTAPLRSLHTSAVNYSTENA